MAWMADLKEPDTTARNRKGGSKEFSYIYCAIVRDGAIEVDFAAKKEKSINAAEDTLRDLKDEKNNHLSFACGKRTLQILYDTKIAYACLVSKAVRMESAFKLLEELKSEFVARTGSSSSSSKFEKNLTGTGLGFVIRTHRTKGRLTYAFVNLTIEGDTSRQGRTPVPINST